VFLWRDFIATTAAAVAAGNSVEALRCQLGAAPARRTLLLSVASTAVSGRRRFAAVRIGSGTR